MKDTSRNRAELPEEISDLKKQIRKLKKTEIACMQADAKLRESEARYRTIIETIQDGYMEVDLDGIFTFMNDVIYEHLGYTREELIGTNISKIQDRAGAKKSARIFNQVYRTGTPCKSFELECIRKDGSKGIYEVSVSLARDVQGRPIGFRSISRDITERKQIEDALRESENRLRMIVENMYDSIWTMDLDLRYTYVSPSEIRTSGYTAEEVVRIPIEKLMTPESYVAAQRVFAEEMELEFGSAPADPERKRIFEMELYRKKGGTYWQESTASFIRDENGKATGIMFVGREITARKKAEQNLQIARDQLLQAEKLAAIGQLSAGVAHEILNPVNIIFLELQLLCAMDNMPQGVREELSICMSQITRIVAIADGLKQLARVHEHQVDRVNLNDVVARIVTLHKAQLMIDKVEIELQCRPDLPDVLMDRTRIEQVMMNLIANARGAMENVEQKVLRISTDWEGAHHIKITVADTGHGIKPDYLSQLFNPFFTTKAQGKGTGLGLSISYGIVKDHGGRIWAENNQWGGASFYISLPVTLSRNTRSSKTYGEVL